ncbi:MAG: RNA polymerase factor sigma-54 [Planctomycetota bacterium]|nr:RNA polymerase factor sigma-54 [Planctomycetota bacterium]
MSSGISAGLSMQTAQRMEMALSPQMIQSMELLQMPVMQLEQRIRQEQLENPTLEIAEIEEMEGEGEEDLGVPDAVGPDEGGGVQTIREDGEEADPDADVHPDRDAAEGLERIDEVDYNWDDVYDDYAPSRGASQDDEEAFDPITNAVARPPSLVEHLLTQLSETPMPDRIRRLAGGMAQKLDANGWLTVPLEETIPEGEEPPSKAELEAALDEVQKLDPDGIGARGLSECLLLQLRNRPEATHAAFGIAQNHLEDLAANRLPKIARDLKCDLEDVKEAADVIRTLNPRPGADFSEEPVLAVRPELIVEGDAEKGYTVRLTSGVQPQVSDFFTALFDNSRRGKIVRERIESDPEKSEAFAQFREQMRRTGLSRKFREKYNNAQWLVKAVAQREKTILAVATEIVRAQEDYLAERLSAPAPLFMQEIADKVGYDISTVSRAVRDKYIDTPLGIKPLKHFFARASGTKEGAEASSSVDVLNRIRDMIEGEDRRRPLRDNEIMERLSADGIVIKRRSIVNYREKLGYPSHSHRKEH